jgi:hypothetical protein
MNKYPHPVEFFEMDGTSREGVVAIDHMVFDSPVWGYIEFAAVEVASLHVGGYVYSMGDGRFRPVPGERSRKIGDRWVCLRIVETEAMRPVRPADFAELKPGLLVAGLPGEYGRVVVTNYPWSGECLVTWDKYYRHGLVRDEEIIRVFPVHPRQPAGV